MIKKILLLAVLFAPAAVFAFHSDGGGGGGSSSGSVNPSSIVPSNLNVTGGSLQAGDVPSVSGTDSFTPLTPFTTFYQYVWFRAPDMVQGTNTVIYTTSTARPYGSATFSNSSDQLVNYADYTFMVPRSFDATVDLRLEDLVDRLSAGDTGTRRYVLSVATVTASTSIDSPTFGNAVNIDISADAGGSTADLERPAGTVTLTGWKSTLSAGCLAIIRLARDGDDSTNDSSTVDSNVIGFNIRYGVTNP